MCVAVLGLALAVSCSKRTDAVKRLEGEWLVRSDPANAGLSERWYEEGAQRGDWSAAPLPDFTARGEVAEYHGVTWYAQSFVLDDPRDSLQIVLNGADGPVDLWINGRHRGTTGEYAEAMAVDVSNAVREGPNEIVLRVNGGGFYGPVSLVRQGRVDDALRMPEADMAARHGEEWVRNAVVYSVYLRSFAEKNALTRLEEELPAIGKLGATVLWLLPVHPVGDANRKGELGSPYAVRDYYAVDPDYGTLEDLKALVRAAHREGMKVILDLVIGHAAWDSQLMFEHPDWFTTDETGAIVSPKAEWSDVAALNLGHHELRKYLIAMMEFWVRDVGIDGFRCDAADHVPLEFWELARRQIERIKPVMMLAEGARPAYHQEAFDVTYGGNTARTLDAILAGKARPSSLHESLRLEQLRYPSGSLRLRYYTNHDWNMWNAPAPVLYGTGGAALLAALVYTLPGIPLIYNGEEAGSPVRLDLFQRALIDWSDRHRTRPVFEELARIRRNPVFVTGGYLPVVTSEPDRVLSFARTGVNDVAVVVANMSDQRVSFSLEVDHLDVREWRDERGGSGILPGPLTFGPYEWNVFSGTRTSQ